MNKKFKVRNIIILILILIIGSGFAYEYYMRSSSRLKALLEDNFSDFQATSAVLSDSPDTAGTVSDLIENYSGDSEICDIFTRLQDNAGVTSVSVNKNYTGAVMIEFEINNRSYGISYISDVNSFASKESFEKYFLADNWYSFDTDTAL